MNKHSILGPSKAARWLNCPASVAAERGQPNEPSPAAIEGTKAHYEAEQVLRQYVETGSVVIPQDIMDGVDVYINDVLAITKHHNFLSVEEMIRIDAIHTECFGTADAFYYDEHNHRLTVWDLKYGFNYVSAEMNWQLIAYAAGIMDHLNIDHEGLVVDLRIVQPRAYSNAGPVRNWLHAGVEIVRHSLQLKAAAEDALNGTGSLKSGDHCRYCLARGECSAFIKSAFNAIDVVETSPQNTVMPSPAELSTMITILQTGKKRLDGLLETVESMAEQLIKDGGSVPGFAIGNGRGSSQWNIPPEQVIAIGEMLGADFRNPKPLTPNQCKKLVDNDVISNYITTQPGAPKLVTSENTKAFKAFSK